MRTIRTIALVGLLAPILGCAARTAPVLTSADASPVRRIYVEQFGNTTEALDARAQLIELVADRDRFEVVDSRDQADAVLRGWIWVKPIRSEPIEARGVGSLQLDDASTNRTIWRAKYEGVDPTEPTSEYLPALALRRAVLYFDRELHQARLQ